MDKTEPQSRGFPPKSVAALPPAKGLQASGLPPLHPSGTSSSASLPSQLDLDLVSLESSSSLAYTSFKDLLPSAASNSPTSAYGREISIRNRLGKQAASASASASASAPASSNPPSSSSSSKSAVTNFLHRLWLHVSWRNPFGACILFVNRHVIPSITRAIDRILQSIRV